MLAMKREVFGLGAAQVVATTIVFACIARMAGVDWPMAVDRRCHLDEQHRASSCIAHRTGGAEPHARSDRLQHAAVPDRRSCRSWRSPPPLTPQGEFSLARR